MLFNSNLIQFRKLSRHSKMSNCAKKRPIVRKTVFPYCSTASDLTLSTQLGPHLRVRETIN